jgi:hypothetical protein
MSSGRSSATIVKGHYTIQVHVKKWTKKTIINSLKSTAYWEQLGIE